jgi:hypothetical protein
MHICPELKLDVEDRALLEISDDEIERLLMAANNSSEADREKLFCWAYLTASNYYCLKVKSEANLTLVDAEELASGFFLEFERTLPRLKSAARFTRYVLKQNLKRYLKRKKRLRQRETNVTEEEINPQTIAASFETPSPPWENWSDEDFHQYKAVLETYRETDEITQKIIKYRLEDPPRPYKNISDQLKMTETSIRMRVMRFYSAVRRNYEEKYKTGVTSLHHLTLYLMKWLIPENTENGDWGKHDTLKGQF